jgi:hypothetical protein
LAGSTAVALAPQLGLPSAFAEPVASFKSPGGQAQAVAALVADVRLGRGDAAKVACSAGATGLARCLRTESLATFAIVAGAGSLGWGRAVEAFRRQVGEDRPLGLVCWGEPGALPAMATLDDAVEAIVLLDQVDGLAPDSAKRPGVLCHVASRRSPAEGRAIARKLSALGGAGRPVVYHWYDADPGFAAPDRDRLDRNADLAWYRTAAFFRRHLDQSAAARTPTIG